MKYLVLPGLASVLLAGCAPTLAPHVPYLPVLRAQGEAEIRIDTGLTGSELQLGYQATNRLVLHSSLLYYERSKTGKSFRSADLGLGYYRPSANGNWRLGLHTGLAYGGGNSGYDNFCPDKCGEAQSQFAVRYAYAYIQPTALFLAHDLTLGFGLRLGRTHYFRLAETHYDYIGSPAQLLDHAGHGSTFLQPVLQLSYRVLPWLALSTTSGGQFFLGRRSALNDMTPLVGQVGAHFVVGKRAVSTPQP